MLGPAGFGLMGLYGLIVDLSQSIAGMGINSSGVRQIAESVGTGDAARIARTTKVLRRIAVLLGMLGAALLCTFSKQVATLTFGTDEHAGAVAFLGLAVFFGAISAGQSALIQGMRRIADLARISVVGAFAGTLICIPVVYFLGERGIVVALVGVSATMALTSWWYGRKVQVEAAPLSAFEFYQEAASLLRLGFAFMASGLLTFGAAYAIRIIVLSHFDFEAAGFYQSAWTLGGLYVGFILQAMGADFYPRLTACNTNNDECNRLVNEQAQISLLLAGPGVLATLTFAPLVVALFYSAKFGPAVDILRWICIGMILRVIAWPMGFIVLAKGRQRIFFWTEVAAAVVHVGLAWLLVPRFGVAGAGAAFFGLYAWHSFLIYLVARRLSNFRWSVANLRIAWLYLPIVGMVFAGFHFLPFWVAVAIGVLAVATTCVHSIRSLLNLVSSGQIPVPIKRVLVRLRLAPPGIL